ncbi:MAG: ABC transporter ATP-binding protein [Candidatus Rokuibacteriota bacterium]|nr:MAG: ABC transporter ATP-binding protein [Candidatus Rokubacteria bacterium]
MTDRRAARLELAHVTKRYGEVAAVRDVSFTVAAGSLVTLLGPSGCGKTTTLRLIAGLEIATAGRILIGGDDVTGLGAADRNVSMVFQSYALFPHMSVLENVAYGPRVAGRSRCEAAAAARETLATVGLAELGDRLPSELSGGQQQRVAIARALVLEPRVLLFDEPLSNLDARLRRRMREEIRELQRRLGITVVYVTHDQEEALGVSDRIIVMNHAVVAQEGAPRELYESPDDVFVAGFMGEANRVKGVLRRVDERTGRVTIGGLTRMLPHRGLAEGVVDIAIRPEAILIGPGLSTDGALRGTVSQAAYLGSRMEYSIASEIGELFVTSPAVDAPLSPGAAVALTLASRGITLIRP